jgi:hypothetical protein
MSVWRFLASAVWREVGVVTRVIQTVAVTIPFTLTLLIGALGGRWSRDLWPWWAWASLTLGLILVAMIVGVFRRAYVLESALEPKIEISDPKQHHKPWTQHASLKAKRYWFVTVTSTTTKRLTGVSVRELELLNARGRVAPESGRYFPLAAEGLSKDELLELTREFELRGRGTKENIDICEMDETDDASRVLLKYATPPNHLVHRKVFPHTLTIRVTANEMPEPVDKTFRIAITTDGFLKMETVNDVTRQAPQPL